ncbi:MAG: tripartite motif-containing protein 71 [Actinomycetota bacterium]|jgi:DNA-binding beta-propeller fold protein YncE|nr:tripartite motif-containing protein 71 [Actinomycetota bacterium]
MTEHLVISSCGPVRRVAAVGLVSILALLLSASPSAAGLTFKGDFGKAGTVASGGLAEPYDVAVDKDGFIYVVDRGTFVVQKYTPKGDFLFSIGVPNGADGTHEDDGQLYYPNAIALNSTGSWLYVADTQNSRIQVFDAIGGGFIMKWGTQGNGDDQMDNPTGIALDANDNVYVADSRNARVMKFSSTGTFITKWGTPGTGVGQFAVPAGIAVNDARGSVYVTDEYIGRFLEFTLGGGYVAEHGLEETGTGYLLHHPDEITVDDAKDRIYVIESGGNGDGDGQEVSMFDASKPGTTSFITDFWGADDDYSGYGYSPHGIFFNPEDGELLVAAGGAPDGRKIFRYNTRGKPKFTEIESVQRQRMVEEKKLMFHVSVNLMVGSCNVKATGTMQTDQDDPFFEGDSWRLVGPRGVSKAKKGMTYKIPLNDEQVRVLKKTHVTVKLQFTSPGGCNNGTDQMDPRSFTDRI